METEAGDWQTEIEGVRDRLGHLLQSGTWSDCSFAVGPKAEIVKAHKFVLSMASPVFETMLKDRWATGNAPIKVSNIAPQTFKEFLVYIYTDKIELASCLSACELYFAAQEFMFKRLAKTCVTFMENNLEPRDVCYAYHVATIFDEAHLKSRCLQEIKTKTKEILLDPSIEQVSLSILKEIVYHDHLSIDSELDLFNAVYKWAKARGHRGLKRTRTSQGVQCKRAKTENESMPGASNQDSGMTEANQEDDKDTVSIKNQGIDLAAIREVMSKIRFLTLTVKQLALGPARSGLLSVTDALPLLMIAAGARDVTPPPEFSTSKAPRTPSDGASTSETCDIDIELTVYNFKTRKRSVTTGKYRCNGLLWSVKIVPGDTVYDPLRPMTIELECHEPFMTDCHVIFTVKLHNATHSNPKSETYNWKFNSKSKKHSVNFMRWSEVCSTTGKWLKSNTLKIEFRISVIQRPLLHSRAAQTADVVTLG